MATSVCPVSPSASHRLRGLCAKSPCLPQLLVVATVGLAGCPKDEPQAEQTREAKADPEPVVDESTLQTDDQRSKRLIRLKERFAADPELATGPDFTQVRADLRQIANEADDVHLRANAALLLGAILEVRGERKQAIDHYRQATKLVSDDAGPYMALALALAAEGEHAEAAKVQKQATDLDPDNLENWLALGQMYIEAGDEKKGAQAYVDYERRRKGLIDGLTLKKGDAYRVSIDERIGCAQALASASDVGTAFALMYALDSEPEPKVREAIVRTMGIQRFEGYLNRLEKQLEKETDADVKAAIAWAVSEIERDPVKAREVPKPEQPPGDAKAETESPDVKADADEGGTAPSEDATPTPAE